MNLYLEKRPDGTYYFRQTKLVNKKQVVKRISLKTRSVKIAKLLAIQLLAKIQMDKIKKFEAEYDSNGNLIKLNVVDEADKQNFMDIQMMMEGHRAALHKRELDRLELEARVDKVKADNEEAKRDKSLDDQNFKLYEKLSNQFSGETLKTLVESYFENISVSKGVEGKYRRVINDFTKFSVEKDVKYLSQIDRKFVFSYVVYLRKKENMTDKTIKNRLGVLSTFFNFQISSGETTAANPFVGHKLVAEEESREPFSIDELIKIFNSSFVKNNQQNKFILMLLLTTGARPNEICQLMQDDIYRELTEDFYIIDINDDGHGKTLKNRSSRRKIYLHQLLIDHGFLAYLDIRKNKRLFDLSKPADKNYSVFFSESFSKLLRDELNIKVKVLYCFRHTTINRLKQHKINVEIREDLTGHTPEGVNGKTYSQRFSPAMLRIETQDILFYKELNLNE